MTLIRVTLTCLALLLVGTVAMAAQGVVIVEKTTINGVAETHQIQMTPQRMRADITGPNGPTTVVFDGTKQVLYMIDTGRMTYSELTKAEADQMGAQLSGAMAQMQEALKGMPPEQRAQMEAMMKGRGLPGLGASAPATYQRGGTQRVGRWTCDVYEVQSNGQRTGEVCTVSPTVLNLNAADFAVTQQMADFIRAMLPQVADTLFRVGTGNAGFSGVPVKRVANVLGRETITEMTDATRQDISDTLFQIPAGFTKEAFGGGLGRGLGRGRGQ